jgi:NAD(P)-dependent dehydrogenase (short-subunit alcohol dehydrogenase family)
MSRLANKVAVVIGGAGGIGGAISQRFAAEGARVYATSRKAIESAPVTRVPGEGNIQTIRADASSTEDLGKVFERIRAEETHIDVLVLNAGISEFSLLGDITEELFDRIFGLNVRSTLFAAQGALDLMQPGGSIVLIGSIADAVGVKGYGVYSASKAAVRSFTRTWANELAPRNIRVNVVSPGPTDTAMIAVAAELNGFHGFSLADAGKVRPIAMSGAGGPVSRPTRHPKYAPP